MATLPNAAFNDPAVVHRICFAARSLPVGCPNYWNLVCTFTVKDKKVHSISPEEARVFVENLKVLSGDVFTSDLTMMSDLIKLLKNTHKNVERIGVILISSRENCANCRGRLSTRPDRVASAVIYDHAHGTIPALHYTKYCRKPGCYYNQHYGYHTVDDSSFISYDSDCLELLYFMASRETAFSLAYIRQLCSLFDWTN